MELVDRYLLEREMPKGAWKRLTLQERQEILGKIENYPNCCKIIGELDWDSDFGNWLNKYNGHFYYEIETIFTALHPIKNEPYYIHIGAVDACGIWVPGSGFGTTKSKKMYDAILRSNKGHWEDVKGYSDHP